MASISPIEQLREIEDKSIAQGAMVTQSTEQAAEWRGIGFRLGENEMVTSMTIVSEVLEPVECTRVPSSKSWFEGIANVRGQLVPVTDLYSFLYGERLPVDRNTRIVLFRLANSISGLVVTAVTGIRNFREDNRYEALPEGLDEKLKPYVAGGFHYSGDEYPVFDFSRLLNDENFMRIAQVREQ